MKDTINKIKRYFKNEKEAIDIWKKIISKGVKRIAYGDWGEGLSWAKSLINDCRYGISLALISLNDKKTAIMYLKSHLNYRKKRVRSIFKLKDVKNKLDSISGNGVRKLT